MSDALTVSGLSQAYGSRRVLNEIDLRLPEGTWMSLIGANGAGKSTLFRTLSGLIRPAGGSVAYFDVSLAEQTVEAKRRFGFAMDPEYLPLELTGIQYLELVASARGVADWGSAALELVGQFALESHFAKRLAACSHGTQKKFGIIAALIGTPPVLLLDEPFNGLDPTSGFALKGTLRKLVSDERVSVLMATHTVEMVATWCDAAVLLRGGQLETIVSMREWREAGRTSHDFEMWVMEQLLPAAPATRSASAG